jgi:hypothetical protein
MTTPFHVCCRSGGSNMNAGTVDGGVTVPAAAALVTYTGGDSTANAASFTAPGGSDMTEAVAGRYVCLYKDGDTVPTTGEYVVAKITSVVGTTINLSTTLRFSFGTVIGAGTGNRSLRIGGAWAGPSSLNTTPINLGIAAMATSGPVQFNMKNDVTYSLTANLSINASSSVGHVRGFTTAYDDGGKATIDGGTSGAAYILVTMGGSAENILWEDIIFNHNGASSDAQLVQVSNGMTNFKGCVFANSRGNGLSNSTNCAATECEVYGNNTSNGETSGVANFGSLYLNRCTIHDNTGSGTNGIRSVGNLFASECIIESNGKHGIEGVGSSNQIVLIRCDIYNNASTGITAVSAIVDSCNFVKNTGVWAAGPAATNYCIHAYNCALGTGTQTNGSANASSGFVVETSTVSLASGTTPWTDPANGDFTIGSTSAAIGAGRGTFTSTASGWGTTTGAPCRSAAQRDATAPATDYPIAANVRNGVSYNSGGSTGTLVVPSTHDVRNGTTFDASSSLTGLLVLPAAADVESGVTYGYSAEFTGTFTKPAVGDVESGVQYGGGGTEFTGTFAVPAQSNVKNTIQYGAGGTEFTGTYVAPSGGCPLVGHGGLVL